MGRWSSEVPTIFETAELCFGWIDGVRKRIDERSYQIRFTINPESIPTSNGKLPRWRAQTNCDFEKPRQHGNSSKPSRPATDSWSFGGSSAPSARKPASAAWQI
jgi:hypothetical protein